MASTLLTRNRNYRLLFSAGALTNLGDGLIVLALPWLATMMTSNAVAIGAVASANRLPWLLFSIPAGVVIDRASHRKLIARADLMRVGIITAILLLALSSPAQGLIWALAGLAFLLGCAEVLRDNAAQTILPTLVDGPDLEAANGQLWSMEQLTGQFIGPPLAGLLIGLGIAVPFGVDVAMLMLAAGLVWLITAPAPMPSETRFVEALREGIGFMRRDRVLLRLAVVLGVANFIAVGVITMQVMFAQEVLGLTAAGYGVVLSVEAIGAITGSLMAPRLLRWFGADRCLAIAIGIWAVGYGVVAIAPNAAVMALALFAVLAAGMVWNVITVSWRQRRIPPELLGRVNSICRFFGWGSMPLGALAAGAVATLLEAPLGREMALRAPFVLAAGACVGLLLYAMKNLRLSEGGG